MKVYEKAIQNYEAKVRFQIRKMERDILTFSKAIERMAATGQCPIVSCDDCPVMQSPEIFRKGCIDKDIKELLNQEVDA